MPKALDLTEQRFGRLVAKTLVRRNGGRYWECQCDCGNTTIVIAGSLRYGSTRSCGCLVLETSRKKGKNRTHGRSKTAEYRIWRNMHTRCYNHNVKCFQHYGKRGIKVCARWHKFENFFADMGKRPSEKHTLERKNFNGNYSPSNCKWATMTEQQNNRRSNRTIQFRGRTMTLEQWSRKTGIRSNTIANRIDRLGWSVEKALTTSSSNHKNRGK